MRHKLTDSQIKAFCKRGRYGDGDGLYLNVSKSGSKSWTFLYMRRGRRREMGLGSYDFGTGRVSLAKAREKAEEIRTIIGGGGDPFVEFSERRDREKVSFGDAADQFLIIMRDTWKNAKHRDQWHMVLNRYAAPIRRIPVDALATDDILRILKPIWENKTETASRLRSRVEKVIDYSTTQGWRTGENPARWKGHLENALPSPRKRQRGHHAAMPYSNVPSFMEQLVTTLGLSSMALQLTILSATRTSETLRAEWSEIDLQTRVWTISSKRMKTGKEHRIPLTETHVKLLDALPRINGSRFLFPSRSGRQPLSNMAMTTQLRRMDMGHFTVHGFRSSFRDWVGEETTFPREVAEQALAHNAGNAVELAYRRGDALERRRKLMEAWASFLRTETTNVLPLRASKSPHSG